METFGCTPEIEFFGNSDEVPRVTELHKAYSNSYNLSLRQKQSNSDIRLPRLYCTFDRTATLPMNNSVGFAGFAATSPATRIVDAHANLVITAVVGICAVKFGQGVVEGGPLGNLSMREQLYDVLNCHFSKTKLD